MNLEEIIKQKVGVIVDVRSQAEYNGGHVEGSINIPLQEIPQNLEKLRAMKSPLLICCASGNRSGQAVSFLVQQGITCVNGGSWMDVEHMLQSA